jgi:hypothetical protein
MFYMIWNYKNINIQFSKMLLVCKMCYISHPLCVFCIYLLYYFWAGYHSLYVSFKLCECLEHHRLLWGWPWQSEWWHITLWMHFAVSTWIANWGSFSLLQDLPILWDYFKVLHWKTVCKLAGQSNKESLNDERKCMFCKPSHCISVKSILILFYHLCLHAAFPPYLSITWLW